MKKLLFSLTLLMTLYTYSQNSKIKFGLQGGLNYSSFRGYNIPFSLDQNFSESSAFAYLFGLTFEYKIQGKLSLKLELNYERKSQKADHSVLYRENYNDPAQLYNYTSRNNYDYLVLPILLKYSFSNKNSFYLNGGPFIGYLLNSNITSDLNAPGINSDTIDTTNNNKRTDIGISFGLGKNFDFGTKKSINIELRENLGITNTNQAPIWRDGNLKTNSINLIVGISLN